MSDPQLDSELLTAARGGDRAALEALLERHQSQIYRFGMKMCRNPEDAAEVLQDTMIAMARGVRDFRGESSLSTWLYTVARSFCIKRRRNSAVTPEAVDDSVRDPSRTPDELLAGKQLEAALDEAINALEPMYRDVLILRDVEGLSAPETAEVLGLTVQAVKSRLHRARVAVRERLAPALGISTGEPAGACPDIVTMFSRHLEDEISADVCSEMERHLEGCPSCRGACDSLKQTLKLCRTSGPQTDVPPQVQSAVKRALRDFLRTS